ncbi:MAG TPA: ACT domain-containing protein [Actinomycetota bacterium]|nr:ACT domain-containing protein [Actinomycetota bacterium]
MAAGNLVSITVVGDDRPGIVGAVTRVLYDSGCNLEDVSSTILRGHFSMMLIVRTPGDLDAPTLEENMASNVSQLGLVVTVRPVSDAPLHVPPPTHMVSVYGADRPGIVFRVADTLADGGVNITDLTSRVIGPEEAPVYALMLEVIAPQEQQMREALRSVSEELSIDVSVRALEVDVL